MDVSPLFLIFRVPFLVIIRLDYGKKRGSTREEREKERLKHKYKREFKGALREIRKDSRFLAREKLNEVMNRCGYNSSICSEMFMLLLVDDLTFTHSVFQGCREKEKSERANGQSGHPGGRVEIPEEEEEVKYFISTSSPHCLIIFKWISPVQLWITCIRLKYMEYTAESSLSWLHTMLSHIPM